jgi:hypothetical protein
MLQAANQGEDADLFAGLGSRVDQRPADHLP